MLPLESSPDPPTPTSPSATLPSQQVIVTELSCLRCARPVGTATANCWPPRGPVRFKPAQISRDSPSCCMMASALPHLRRAPIRLKRS